MSGLLYTQLKEHIIHDVESGKYAPGDQLPSQRELVQQFNMSHMTVRRAISELLTEGVIQAIPGKGLYVPEKKHLTETSMVGFTGEMSALGYHVSSRILEKSLIPASTIIARSLNIEVGSELAFLSRLRFINGEPISFQYSYLAHQFCPGVLDLIEEESSLYEVLLQVYKISLINTITTVEAVLAQASQCTLLNLREPAALLIIEQINTNESRQGIEYSRLAYRGDKYVMQTRQ